MSDRELAPNFIRGAVYLLDTSAWGGSGLSPAAQKFTDTEVEFLCSARNSSKREERYYFRIVRPDYQKIWTKRTFNLPEHELGSTVERIISLPPTPEEIASAKTQLTSLLAELSS